ncbi:MAG: UPF0102 protein [Hyphococcus sp.]|nr:MAG: UPF0102 protein [Marinicaulis sp.]
MKATPQSRRRSEAAGRRAEWLAAFLMMAKGFSIVRRRFKAPNGEIDLIAKRGKLLVFVEVKSRAQLDSAIEAVTHTNRRRVSNAAGMFLAHNPDLAQMDMRYDIIAIAGWRMRHLTNAWQDDF